MCLQVSQEVPDELPTKVYRPFSNFAIVGRAQGYGTFKHFPNRQREKPPDPEAIEKCKSVNRTFN